MVGVRMGQCPVALVSRMEMNSGAGCTVLSAAAVHLARLRCWILYYVHVTLFFKGCPSWSWVQVSCCEWDPEKTENTRPW